MRAILPGRAAVGALPRRVCAAGPAAQSGRPSVRQPVHGQPAVGEAPRRYPRRRARSRRRARCGCGPDCERMHELARSPTVPNTELSWTTPEQREQHRPGPGEPAIRAHVLHVQHAAGQVLPPGRRQPARDVPAVADEDDPDRHPLAVDLDVERHARDAAVRHIAYAVAGHLPTRCESPVPAPDHLADIRRCSRCSGTPTPSMYAMSTPPGDAGVDRRARCPRRCSAPAPWRNGSACPPGRRRAAAPGRWAICGDRGDGSVAARNAERHRLAVDQLVEVGLRVPPQDPGVRQGLADRRPPHRRELPEASLTITVRPRAGRQRGRRRRRDQRRTPRLDRPQHPAETARCPRRGRARR